MPFLVPLPLIRPTGYWVEQIRAVFGQVLTREDWDEIAASARDCIYAQVLKQERVAIEQL